MRIRRHTGSPGAWSPGPGPDTHAESGTDAGPGPGPGVDFSPGSPWRRFARELGLVALVALVGYGISAYWISPGAVFAAEHAVPRVLEMPEAQARGALEELGFKVRLDGERTNPEIPRGAVVWQDPPPDMVVPPNSPVQLVLSGGPAPVNVPDVIGLSLPFAEGILEAAGIRVGRVDRVRSDQETDVVLSVRPPPGNGRPRGSSVDLLVSSGQGGAQ